MKKIRTAWISRATKTVIAHSDFSGCSGIIDISDCFKLDFLPVFRPLLRENRANFHGKADADSVSG